MSVPLLDLKRQYAALKDEILPVIHEVCESQYFIGGPQVAAFEADVAAYCGTAHAVGVSSGTDALLISLMALGIGPGDGVLTTPYTFFATAGCISRLGAIPVFVDIDPVTFNIDPDEAAKRLRAGGDVQIKAIIPVHLYGQAADMGRINALAAEFDLPVIEDAAQAIGCEYPTADSGACRAGSMGTLGCFSFFPSKNLGGFGDGGMVVTNSDALAASLLSLRNHGMDPKYYHAVIGGNFRLDALQAAVLSIKLRYLDQWHAARRANAARYDAAFDGSVIQTPAAVYRARGVPQYHIYNQYVVRVPNRDKVRAALTEASIGCEVYYPLPLHRQACFAHLGYAAGSMPVSEQAAEQTLALPIYPELTEDQQDEVIAALRAAVA
jgi:dTDP-4-amino-4,6-dideoxygalactose transaminase